MTSYTLTVITCVLLGVTLALAKAAINVEPSETVGNRKFNLPTPRNISLGESNMPTSWQVQAAEIVQEAYEYQSTDSGRLSMISDLFAEKHPYWYWNVALNYRHIFHRLGYYVEISIDNHHLYIFSTT